MDIPVIKNVLEESDAIAAQNRAISNKHNLLVVNIMSSPGSGKTTLLQKTIPLLRERGIECAVIEGDITSTIDAEKLSPLGIQVVQANTEPFGGDCHVGSHLIHSALEILDLTKIKILFIENIGNLVCPAEFYLGEDVKVVVLSIAEGEDKPLKYPLMFRECSLCVLSKTDLAPYVDVDIERVKGNIGKVHGGMTVLLVSSKNGEGVGQWVEWLASNVVR